MKWKYFFGLLFFCSAFLTVFEMLSYNPNLPLKQSTPKYSTSTQSTVAVTELTMPVPTLSWKEIVRHEQMKYKNEWGFYRGIIKYNRDDFILPGYRILNSIDRLETRIMPQYIGSGNSIMRKVKDETVQDTRNYFYLLEKIMDSTWKCRSACSSPNKIKEHMGTDFLTILELFKPKNVSLYRKIKQKLAFLENPIGLMKYIDTFVINLIYMSNSCIAKYNLWNNERSTSYKFYQEINKDGSYDIEKLLERGKIKYFSKTIGKKRFRRHLLINR